MFNSDLHKWTVPRCCPNPSIYWSNDFDARICQNCGVIIADWKENETNFTHLKVRTHLSFLKAICKPEKLIEKVKQYNMTAIAKVEFGNMCGAPSFVKDCEDNGIKPILGVEFNVKIYKSVEYPVVFIALNRIGYSELVKLTTIAWCKRKTIKSDPFIIFSDIPQSNNFILLIKPHNEFIDTFYQSRMSNIFIDVDNIDQCENAKIISEQFGYPVVVTTNVLYLNEDDIESYRTALKIGNHNITYNSDLNYFKSVENIYTEFGEFNEWIENANKIAGSVQDYGLVNKEFIIPTFKDKHGEWSIEDACYNLEDLSWTRLRELGLDTDQVYVDRLEYELNTIRNKKFSSYFLIINEIIEYMISTNKLKPFGRGSSVGSLVCYILNITSIDPIVHRVPFERFINQGRKDLPDVDTDITQEGRGDVLKHIADIHGSKKVAQIATYQTMALKAAIDNVGRTLQIPYAVNKELRKEIADDVTNIDDLNFKIKETMHNTDSTWVTKSQSLCGVAKNLSYHAAGVVISNNDLDELVPLLPEHDGIYGIQYDMRDCEILGLLKLDMLGLKTLDVIQHTIEGINLDIYNLPLDDQATFNLISSGNYVSIFQLDSTGYRKLCRQLEPMSFDHSMALNALYRPGPLESGVTDQYIKRRHGKEKPISWHPWLDDVLSDTYQTVLFQEQAMAMSRIIAGFTDVEADKFRKGIGKKIPEVVEACLKDFKKGAIKMEGLAPPPGFDGGLEVWIDDLTKKLEGYARYMWNRGHCLHGESKILTCNRGLIPIKDIVVGEEIWSVRENTGNLFRNRVINVINNGIRDTVKVSSSDGRTIISTPNHRYFTAKHQYVNASDLRFGDFLKMLNKGVSHKDPTIHNNYVKSTQLHDKCEVWDLTMEQDPNFIANGFVVHNSAGYGLITYVTAYLEAHYPLEYFVSLLNTNINKPPKLAVLIRSILSKKVSIVPPNLNESGNNYSVGSDDKIYMGLGTIRSVGKSAQTIIDERNTNGRFMSFIEFCQRLPSINKTVKINLVKAGALSWDSMLCDRDKILNTDIISKFAKKRTKKFDGSKAAPLEIAMQCSILGNDFSEIERQENEKTVLSSYITGHPATVYQCLYPYLESGSAKVICPVVLRECDAGESILLIGMIDTLTKKMTKDYGPNRPSRPYINLNVSDGESSINFNIWYPLCEDLQKILVVNQIAVFECVTRRDKFREDVMSVSVKNAIMLSYGLPIQGIFWHNGIDYKELLTKIGGIEDTTIAIGNRNYTSIRGVLTIKPDIIKDVVSGIDNVSFLLYMG